MSDIELIPQVETPRRKSGVKGIIIGLLLLAILVTIFLLIFFNSDNSDKITTKVEQKQYSTSFTIYSVLRENPLEIPVVFLLPQNNYKTDHVSLNNDFLFGLIEYKPANNLEVTISFDAFNSPNLNTGELYDTNLRIICIYFKDYNDPDPNPELDALQIVKTFSVTDTKKSYSVTFKVNNSKYTTAIPTIINAPTYMTDNDFYVDTLLAQEPLPQLSVTNGKISLKYTV